MTLLPLLLAFCVAAHAGPVDDGGRKAAQMHYLKASLLAKKGAPAEALQEYEEAFGHDRSGFLCREAAELALEAGNIDKALLWALRLVELEPKSAGSHVLAGKAHWARGDGPAAEAAFEAALKLDPKSAESIFSLGSLLAARSPEKARAMLEKFVAQNPDQAAEAHFQLAKLDLEQGRVKPAIDRLNKAVALDPENLSLRFALAQAYEGSASTAAALAQYDEILRLDPYNVAVVDHVAEVHDALGNREEARRRFLEAVRLQPNDPAACLWLAMDLEGQGDFAGAADRLRQSAALAEDPTLNLRLSYYLSQSGRLKEAVELLEKAAAKWPSDDQVAYFLALGYDDLKQMDKAAAVLRRVLELKPAFRDARFQLATLLERENKMPEAEAQFRLLLADRPDDASVLNYLGYSLADRGLKLDEAHQLVSRAVELDPRNGAYRDSLGWALFKLGRSSEAVTELERALELLPEDETLWDHLGDALAASNSPAAAWRAWRRAQALGGEKTGAAKKASKLQGQFTPESLGELYLEHLAALQGPPVKVSALCRLEGAVLGRTFKHEAMLSYSTPDEVSLEILGPLFAPLVRMRLGRDGFVMDQLKVAGVKPEALSDAVYGTLFTLREFLSGRLYQLRPAVYRKGWRSQAVEVPGWRVGLDAAGGRAASLTPIEAGTRLLLDGSVRVGGHALPRTMSVSGLGYTVSVTLEQANAEFPARP